MDLRDLRTFGRSWGLVVTREDDLQKTTVTSEGREIFSASAPDGKNHHVEFLQRQT